MFECKVWHQVLQNPVWGMKNVAEFSKFLLFNNLKITNLCNEVALPEKIDSKMNDVDILPTLDDNMARSMDLFYIW